MQKILNVAEKNDAAKTISAILSNGTASNTAGASQYNRVYQFQYDGFSAEPNGLRSNVQMLFTSVTGHLMTVGFSQQNHKKWQTCRPSELFQAPVDRFVPDDMKNVQKNLENLVRTANLLVLWTDCDREGENIGFEVVHVCRNVKRAIPVKRARFSEMTPAAIRRAIANLIAPDERLSEAVECRRELDLRIGAAFTRFQTMRLQKTYQQLNSQVISFGPCQFPTLGFVVDRWRQRSDFVDEEFWKLALTHKSDGENGEQPFHVDFNWARVKLFDDDLVNVICDECKDANLATVTRVDNRQRSKWRPVALDTVELEKAASRWLRINARETMAIAEKLYTSGYISYPRTETNIFPKNLDLRPLVELQTVDGRWVNFAQRVLQNGPNPRNGTKTDNAHPPIHPTKYAPNLPGNEARIYEFIVRHFLACVSRDAIGHECKVEIKIAEENFHAKGLSVIERNYLEVYTYHYWGDKNLPPYQNGQQFVPSKIEVVGGRTVPPSLLTEADLISLMENHGIGTDATHADHIEKIKTREYSTVVDQKFHPCSLGIGLVEGYESIGQRMSKPELRAEMEVDFAAICNGRKTRQQVLDAQLSRYSRAFTALERGAIKLEDAIRKYFGGTSQNAQNGGTRSDQNFPTQTSEPVLKCNRCPCLMYLKQNRRRSHPESQNNAQSMSWEISCDGYPSCKASIYIPNFALAVEVSPTKCPRCSDPSSDNSQELPKLLNFRFKPNSVPPYFGVEYTGCLAGCNSDLLNLFREHADLGPSRSGGSNHTSVHSQSRSYSSSSSSGQTGVTAPRRGASAGGSISQRTANTSRGMTRATSARSTRVSASRGRATSRSSGRSRGTRGANRVGRTSARNSFANARDMSTSNFSEDFSSPFSGAQGSSSFSNNEIPRMNCLCEQQVVERTVRKDGPNQGRKFYCCANRNCDFFLWASDNLN